MKDILRFSLIFLLSFFVSIPYAIVALANDYVVNPCSAGFACILDWRFDRLILFLVGITIATYVVFRQTFIYDKWNLLTRIIGFGSMVCLVWIIFKMTM